MRRIAAVFLGKTSGKISRSFGKGGGTALPGLIADRLAPDLTTHLSSQLPCGSIIVTGTNGKTTTSRLISSFLQQSGFSVVHNRAGSNLMRGLLTALLNASNSWGRLNVSRQSIGLFEVDEAVLPFAIAELDPRVVVFNNLFRDQLDRYGEVDAIAFKWRKAVSKLSDRTTLVLNADDPLVASLADNTGAKVVFFGVADTSCGQTEMGHAADSKSCPNCQANLEYSISFFGHLGHYRCPKCGRTRPDLDLTATKVVFDGFAGTQIDLTSRQESRTAYIKLPGLYNVYNALAATSASLAVGVSFESVSKGLASFTAAFGRIEHLQINGRNVYLMLVKNPIGFSEVLRTIYADGQQKNLLFVLNDRTADGRDVSWIWDVDFEAYSNHPSRIETAGIRAEDMALRLKYAGIGQNDPGVKETETGRFGALAVTRDVKTALYGAVARLAAGDTLFVLPTYTAMLEIQDFLAKDGLIKQYWERD